MCQFVRKCGCKKGETCGRHCISVQGEPNLCAKHKEKYLSNEASRKKHKYDVLYVTKNSRIKKAEELLIIANQRIMDLEKEVIYLKNESKILQKQCIELKNSVEQDSSEIRNLNRKFTEMLTMFTSKCAEMDGIVNSIRTQYKSLQAVNESKVPIDRFRVLEEEVKKLRLQIISSKKKIANIQANTRR